MPPSIPEQAEPSAKTIRAPLSWADLEKAAPAMLAAFRAVGPTVECAGTSPVLLELVKIRASQMNRCAFCLALHVGKARQRGVPQEKLDLLSAWPEAGVFSPAERAALAWTEALTGLSEAEPPANLLDALRSHLTIQQIVELSGAVALINAWNRLIAGFRIRPELR